jgi:hypothetical protein
MHLSLGRSVSRLPKRFPIGATYVVEGRGGEDGKLRVFSRYVVLPDGQRINLGADPENVPEKHALGLEPRVVPGPVPSRARRPRSRQTPAATRNGGKRRSTRPKKISANAGTTRRPRR